MADIAKFFEALSERAYKENDLSDITYAMCEADVKFRKFFLDFFFKDAHLDASKVTIEREHSEANGRPDFWIKDEEGIGYIVEVKIWDGKHHFDDYFDILKKSASNDATEDEVWHRLGYIANYESVKDVEVTIGDRRQKVKGLCRVTTWKEFCDALQAANYFEHPVISAYAAYVKRVCPFDGFTVPEDWTIRVNDFKDIKKFDAILKAVVEPTTYAKETSSLSGVSGVKLYTGSPRRFRSMQWMGQFFEWKIASGALSGKTVWGWLGARYTQNGAVVCVEFEDKTGWGKPVCDYYKSNIKDGILRFYAKDSIDVATSVEKLDEFFRNVLRAIQKGGILCAEDDVYCMSETCVCHYSTPLLSMKCLPFALKNHFIDKDFTHKMAECGYDFAFVYGNDQEMPDSHCGRYFELRKKSEDKEAGNCTIYRGWIGVDYNSSCCKDKNREDSGTYWDAPVFLIEISKDLPAAESLPENSWGWRCVELGEKSDWKVALWEAKNELFKLVSNEKRNVIRKEQ